MDTDRSPDEWIQERRQNTVKDGKMIAQQISVDYTSYVPAALNGSTLETSDLSTISDMSISWAERRK